MMTQCRRGTWFLGGLIILVCVLSLTGCGSLRKKFTRTPKTKASDTFIPVLEPVEYAEVRETPAQAYAQHYSMVKIYFRDLDEMLGQRDGSDKRELYTFTQLLSHFDAMAVLLDDTGKKDAALMRARLEDVLKAYDDMRSMRRYDRISADVRLIERDILKRLKPAVVAGSIAAEE